MQAESIHTALSTRVSLTLLVLLIPFLVRAEQPDALDTTISYLISYVSGSGLTFVRNSNTYTAAEAAEHMSKKYRHFKHDISTAEGFIELCATKSLLSGKPYLVITEQGEQVRTSEWLLAALSEYRTRNRDTSTHWRPNLNHSQRLEAHDRSG